MNTTTSDPSEWPPDFTELREIDTLLRCGVCYEIMETAMIVPSCSHNYCSLCIRKYMSFNNQCPTCRISVTDLDLKNNRILDELIRHFSSVRSKLLRVLSNKSQRDACEKADTSTTQRIETRIHQTKKTSTQQKPKRIISEDDEDSDEDFKPPQRSARKKKYIHESSASDDSDLEIIETAPKNTQSNSLGSSKNKSGSSMVEAALPSQQVKSGAGKWTASQLVGISRLHSAPSSLADSSKTPTRSETNASTATSLNRSLSDVTSPSTSSGASVKKVPCPVCGVPVTERYINIHLDRCLNAPPPQQTRTSAPFKRKTLPKLVYNLMGDKDIRRRLNDVGLSTQGDRRTLIKRHQEFTLIYNTQCDSLNPKSAEEIVRDMQKSSAKLMFKPSASTSVPNNALNITKGATAGQIEQAQKNYVKQHKSQFDQLIAETKARMKRKKEEMLRKKKEESEKKTNEAMENENNGETENKTETCEPVTFSIDSQSTADGENSTQSVIDVVENSTRTSVDVKNSTQTLVHQKSLTISGDHDTDKVTQQVTFANNGSETTKNQTQPTLTEGSANNGVKNTAKTAELNGFNGNKSTNEKTVKRLSSFQSDSSSKDMFCDDTGDSRIAQIIPSQNRPSEMDKHSKQDKSSSKEASLSEAGHTTNREAADNIKSNVSNAIERSSDYDNSRDIEATGQTQIVNNDKNLTQQNHPFVSTQTQFEGPLISQASSENLAWLSQKTPLENSQRSESCKSASSFTLFEDSDEDMVLKDSGVATVETESVGSPVFHGSSMDYGTIATPPLLLSPNRNNNAVKQENMVLNEFDCDVIKQECDVKEREDIVGNYKSGAYCGVTNTDEIVDGNPKDNDCDVIEKDSIVDKREKEASKSVIESHEEKANSGDVLEHVKQLSTDLCTGNKKDRKKKRRKSKNQTPIRDFEESVAISHSKDESSKKESKRKRKSDKNKDETEKLIEPEQMIDNNKKSKDKNIKSGKQPESSDPQSEQSKTTDKQHKELKKKKKNKHKPSPLETSETEHVSLSEDTISQSKNDAVHNQPTRISQKRKRGTPVNSSESEAVTTKSRSKKRRKSKGGTNQEDEGGDLVLANQNRAGDNVISGSLDEVATSTRRRSSRKGKSTK